MGIKRHAAHSQLEQLFDNYEKNVLAPAARLLAQFAMRDAGYVEGGETKLSRDPWDGLSAESRKQVDEVLKRYTNADGTRKEGYMKAPNGKPTNLSERNWVLVRTPNFKKWFGNWDLGLHAFMVVPTVAAPFNSVKEGAAWAKANGIIGLMSPEDTNGKGALNISASSVSEMLNLSQMNKSASPAVHYAALTKIRDIIRESEIADTHPDYKKGSDGKRNEANGINPNVEIDVIYGAIRFDNSVYRVKTTLKRYLDVNSPTKAYAYQVSEIEVLAGKPENAYTFGTRSTSISGLNLLQGVKKANGKLVLDDYSKIIDENGEPLVVYHGTDAEFNAFDPGKIGTHTDYGAYGQGF